MKRNKDAKREWRAPWDMKPGDVVRMPSGTLYQKQPNDSLRRVNPK